MRKKIRFYWRLIRQIHWWQRSKQYRIIHQNHLSATIKYSWKFRSFDARQPRRTKRTIESRKMCSFSAVNWKITKIVFRLILNDFKEIVYSFWWHFKNNNIFDRVRYDCSAVIHSVCESEWVCASTCTPRVVRMWGPIEEIAIEWVCEKEREKSPKPRKICTPEGLYWLYVFDSCALVAAAAYASFFFQFYRQKSFFENVCSFIRYIEYVHVNGSAAPNLSS